MAKDSDQNQTPTGSLNVERALSWVRDFLVLLVVPALLWIMKLEVSNAERDLRILQLQGDLSRIESIADRVQKIEVQLARTEGKLDTTNQLLTDVKNAVVKSR